MILADSSVWIDHIRAPDPRLERLLQDDRVLSHPCVTGEIALGSMRDRIAIVGFIANLPQAALADDEEVLAMIERDALSGSGIGYVDAHLAASVRLTAGTTLWTRDKRLHAVAERLSIAAPMLH